MQQDSDKAAAWYAKRRAEAVRADRQAPWIGLAAAVACPLWFVGAAALDLRDGAEPVRIGILALCFLGCAWPAAFLLRARASWVLAGSMAGFCWVAAGLCLIAHDAFDGGVTGLVAFVAAANALAVLWVIATRSA